MNGTVLIQSLIGGLGIGSIYALVAIGYSLVYRTMGLANFAHGNILMVGAYIGTVFYVSMHTNFIIAIIISSILIGILGMVMERILRPLGKMDLIYMMLGTLGIGIVLQNLAIIIWGTDGIAVQYPIKNEPWVIGNISISPYTLVIICASATVVLALQFFLHKTKLGLAMRSSAQEKEMSLVLGMNVNLMNALTLGLGSVLAAIAGVMVGPVFYVSPDMSSSVGIIGFAAAILGGFGSIPGAIIGGLTFGVLQTMVATQVSEWSQVIAFVIFVFVLIIKPSGIVGERVVDKI
ncbi:branched-chain amino acid ABC transporter permease [Neobacillus sp. OS1-32]|uniref:Branched-chain amino acid ABC transporter permease n=1 Tax=Neobacillus paridis TaxID=2803862 RepID=A0ABS1TUE3_9BACI|nr:MULTISPECIES: branched-chain amino acid ABC transporter permease [Neobacillus]MBL4954924.1 branched-chain amino acid ABC transporter permease [Neobacillus paridis]WML30160.1 branched-chain amino acid ABC transporter permease [Neobacillus sp. OS1-32]